MKILVCFNRETGLYSESYETITSLPQSDTYSVTEEASVLTSPTHRYFVRLCPLETRRGCL